MSDFKDEDIPISCGECSKIVQGGRAMQKHILDNHKNYTPEEAVHYAENWMLSAFEEIEREALEYARMLQTRSKGKYYVS